MIFITTEGHGYLKVTHKQLHTAILKGFKPSAYPYLTKSHALLEEDCDASAFLATFDNPPPVKHKHQRDINRNLYDAITPQVVAYILVHKYAKSRFF